jgi:hypothetical protein
MSGIDADSLKVIPVKRRLEEERSDGSSSNHFTPLVFPFGTNKRRFSLTKSLRSHFAGRAEWRYTA